METYKPAASRRTHLLLAGVMWSAVGSLLLYFGSRWLLGYRWGVLLLPPAVGVGLLKSRLVLDRTAGRIVDRIQARGDRRCIGGFLSLKSWGLVLIMTIAGRLIRSSAFSRTLVGLLYTTVGTALLWSSHGLWRSWRQADRKIQ
jgi:hypothetical protein